jgi:hypothetical protein
MAYDYEGSVEFRGDASRALECARDLLSAKGLNVLPLSGNQLHFENTGSYLNTKKQPLLMVSKGVITATGSALTVQAELGNLRALVKFLVLLITVMAIPETAMLAVILVMVAKQPELLPVCFLTLAPITFVLFLMPKLQRGVIGRALDALLNEVAGVELPRGQTGRGRSDGFEYKSSVHLFGLPLVHIAMSQQSRGVAKGIIAVGDVAFGVLFAMGGFAVGGISVGGGAFGVIAVGGGAFGAVSVGGLAVGLLAFGGLAIGL